MKLKELIRYIERTAPCGSTLSFFDDSDGGYSTGQAEFISGAIAEKSGLTRTSRITIDFRAAPDGGVPLDRDGFVAWLHGLAGSHGRNVQVLIRLHGGDGSGGAFKDMLTDGMWSRIEHRGDGCYALTEPTKNTLGYSLADTVNWEGSAQSGGLGS